MTSKIFNFGTSEFNTDFKSVKKVEKTPGKK